MHLLAYSNKAALWGKVGSCFGCRFNITWDDALVLKYDIILQGAQQEDAC